MENFSKEEHQYKQILVDNLVCQRRFHLGFEEGSAHVSNICISCPHCGVVIFEAHQHPDVQFLREENLIKIPNDSDITLTKCLFNKNEKKQ